DLEARPVEEEEVRVEGGAAADADDDVWLGREWWDKNDRRFVTRMRQLHPEREVAIRRAGAGLTRHTIRSTGRRITRGKASKRSRSSRTGSSAITSAMR